MEIAIQRDEKDENVYTVTINRNINIETLMVPQITRVGTKYYGFDEWRVREWVPLITKIHSSSKNSKKKNQPLIIGLLPDRSTHYANGNFMWSTYKKGEEPYEVLQLCVDGHCLIIGLDRNGAVCKPIKDLLSDNNTIVVGVKMNEVAKKLEEQCGLVITRPVDLQALAAEVHRLEKGYYRKCGLEKLAVKVLGEEWNMAKPASIRWCGDDEYGSLSDDKIKYGTVEAFLAYQMGLKLLMNDSN